MFHAIADFFMSQLDSASYLGIFVLMTIESSVIPFPSEIVMIPAGFLAYQGKMSGTGAFAAGTAGSLCGALINYYIGLLGGRALLLRYGKYVFIQPEMLDKVDQFFAKHGDIATFSARLVFGIRQLISVPAGIARMNLAKFCIYTTAGAGIWVGFLTWLGYFLASTQSDWPAIWKQNNFFFIAGGIVSALLLAALIYAAKKKAE